MKIRKYVFGLSLLFVLAVFQLQAQVPANNPYTSRYADKVGKHWTDSLSWKNTVDVTSVSKVVNSGGKVDSLALHTLLKSISTKGGGVVYFPAGEYFLNFHLRLFDGVILRGADPVGVKDALQDGYRPATKFVFPKYDGVVSKAFKRIYADTAGVSRSGLVNLDINRAVIAFYAGRYTSEITPGGRTMIAQALHSNIIIYGIRQNNAATPDPNVPMDIQKREGVNQKWPWRFGASVDISVSRNCVVANSRINDAVTDDFPQTYKTSDNDVLTGEEGSFRFGDHEGVVINAYKISFFYTKGGVLTRYKRHPFLPTKRPDTEPILFSPGVEILDNTIYTSIRYEKIIAGGVDPVIRGNVEKNIYNDNYLVGKNGWLSLRWTMIAKTDTLFERKSYVHGKDTLQYRLMKPHKIEPGKKYPLVVFFCSQAEKGKDNNIQLRNFVSLFARPENRLRYPCYVLVPQQPLRDEWGLDIQRDTITRAMRSTVELVKGLISDGSAEPTRLYITGFSDAGGYAVWEMLYRFPELNFAAGVPMNAMFDMKKNHLKEICKVPLWVALGDLDRQRSEPFVKLLKESLTKGACNYKLSVFTEAGIDSHIGLARDPEFLPWLFSQQRKIVK